MITIIYMRFALAKLVSRGRVAVLAVFALFGAALVGSTSLHAADTIQLRWEVSI